MKRFKTFDPKDHNIGWPMEIITKKPKETLYVYTMGKGKKDEIYIHLKCIGTYSDDLDHITFSLEELPKFMGALNEVIKKAQENEGKKDSDDED